MINLARSVICLASSSEQDRKTDVMNANKNCLKSYNGRRKFILICRWTNQ